MIITTLYGMKSVKPSKKHLDKLEAAKAYLGDKYRLAHSIKKLDEPLK